MLVHTPLNTTIAYYSIFAVRDRWSRRIRCLACVVCIVAPRMYTRNCAHPYVRSSIWYMCTVCVSVCSAGCLSACTCKTYACCRACKRARACFVLRIRARAPARFMSGEPSALAWPLLAYYILYTVYITPHEMRSECRVCAAAFWRFHLQLCACMRA